MFYMKPLLWILNIKGNSISHFSFNFFDVLFIWFLTNKTNYTQRKFLIDITQSYFSYTYLHFDIRIQQTKCSYIVDWGLYALIYFACLKTLQRSYQKYQITFNCLSADNPHWTHKRKLLPFFHLSKKGWYCYA